MAYVTVYSPKGEKFEVASRDRADKLILQDGWTQTPPVKEEAVEKPKRAPRRKKKEAPIEEPVVVPSFFEAMDVVDAEEPGDDS